MDDERETTSLRHRRKKGTMSLSCCFQGHSRRFDSYDSSFSSPDVDKSSPVTRSPSSWFRSKGHEIPEIKGRCRNFISRMGRPARRHHSADFSYDPLSYALNFDEGSSDDSHVDVFSSRLPVSPPRRTRIKDLDLPSSRCAGRKNVQSPTEAAVRQSIESPTAAGRTSVESPTAAAAGGRGTVERPPPVSREISVE